MTREGGASERNRPTILAHRYNIVAVRVVVYTPF